MKTIGLLGGTSWPSTPLYYSCLNEMTAQKLGGYHSAKIILYSIDYHPIKSLYPDGWDKIPDLLAEELKLLDAMGPDCIVICNNTLHKGYDILCERGFELRAPVIHIVDAAARAAQAQGLQRLLLLGTKFTMEDGFFARRLQTHNLEVGTPLPEDRIEIQAIQTEISAGRMRDEFRKRFKNMLAKYNDYDGIVLGCTELPLAIPERETTLPIINPITAQCAEAISFALT